MSYITIQPTAPAIAFGVVYTDNQVIIPQHSLPLAELSSLFPILEEWGCTKKQLRLLTFMIQEGMEGHILEEGTVDLQFELEGEDLEQEEMLRTLEAMEEEQAALEPMPPAVEYYPSDGEDEEGRA